MDYLLQKIASLIKMYILIIYFLGWWRSDFIYNHHSAVEWVQNILENVSLPFDSHVGDFQGSLHLWPRRSLRQSLWISPFTRAICADSASLPHTHSFKTFIVKYFRRERVKKGTVKTCVSPLSLSNKTLPTKLMLLSTCISLPSNITILNLDLIIIIIKLANYQIR